MRIGFIGLGNVGAALARNLIKGGHGLIVHDLNRERAAELLAQGAAWGDSPHALSKISDTVVTSLPTPMAVNAVMEGEQGVLSGLRAGGTWIEMSTNDTEQIKRLAALAVQKGIATLEAPVTGGCHRARSGDITILVGGDELVFRQQQPILQAMGGQVLYMGKLGNASVIKVISNMLAFLHLVGLGEGLMLAKKAGVDLRDAFEGIKASSGNSFVHETESQVILNGSYNIGFTMDLACKDLGLALQLGKELGVPLTLTSQVAHIFAHARQQYGDRAWSTQVVKLLEDELGENLRAPGFPAELTV